MNYELVIEDLQNLSDPLVLHYAEKHSLEQVWHGGDDKTQALVGCEYNFTLENYGGADARYLEYFTTNEKRYRLTKRVESTGEIVYQGFFLPETYEEPYEAQIHYVRFSAVDGIGLLRGKQFDPSFYDKEHFVTDVICAILKMTGVMFEVYLAPAIRNHLKKKWHEIVIDGRKYFDDDKLPDVHKILEEIVGSMRCQLYQSQGRWYVEGVNFRHLRKVRYDRYDLDGNFLGEVELEKNIKVVHWSPTPAISMVPGLKKVVVTHEAAKLTVSKEVFKETEISWAKASGVVGEFNPRHWNYTHWVPKVRASEYFLELPAGTLSQYNPGNKIDIKEKLYVLKNTKVRMKLSFELLPQKEYGITPEQINARRISGIWIDMQVYRVKLNNTVLFHNENTNIGDVTRLVFDDNLKGNVDLEFVAQENGILDIELFEPYGLYNDTLINWVRLVELSVEDIEQRDNFVYTEDINEESTQVKDIELHFSDDISTESKSFYLEKIRAFDENSGYSIEVPVRYGRQQNGKNYAIVSVEGAVLIEQFPEFVSHQIYIFGVKVNNVIFNLNGGEEMAVETESFYSSGSFWVIVKPYKPASIDRIEWLKWSDAVYGVEQKPYAQVVAEIEGKLFKDPHLRIEASVQEPIKYNDLIEFVYNGQKKYFVPTNINMNDDSGDTQVTLIEGVYAGQSAGNIPPYIYAGPDIYINPGVTSVQITEAVAYDPDGEIASLLWEKLEGDPGENYSSPSVLNPLISGLTGNEYTFRLTGTDTTGDQASDIMKVFRIGEYEIQFELISSDSASSQSGSFVEEVWKMNVVPEPPQEISINIDFEALLSIYLSQGQDNAFVYFNMKKNGISLVGNGFQAAEAGDETFTNLVQYTAGSEILLTFEARVDPQNSQSAVQALVQFSATSAAFVNGLGSITNLPAVKAVSADY